MELEKYTERSKGFVQAAQNLALRSGHQRLVPEHLLKILLDDKEGLCANLINKFGQVADAIGPELGSKVVLVTVTNDPEHDRPDLLLKLARDRQADMSGWLFLTGTPGDVAKITTAFGIDNRRLPDGSPNHITRVFMLGPDLRQQHEYAGMAMNSQQVAADIKDQVEHGGA